MPVRDSMADLISRVRELIEDEAGADQVFSDQRIQDTLDTRRLHAIRRQLTPVSSVDENGVTSYLEFYADRGFWEADVTLQTGSYATLTDETTPAISASDYRVGKWTLDASLNPPVYLTGYAYDIYAAAADMLEQWAARVKDDYDFLSSGRTFKRSQQGEGIERVIRMYRARQWITTSQMVRTDMNVF